MGDFNQMSSDALIENPVKGPKCEPCDGTGKVLVKEGEATTEVKCSSCEGRGWSVIGTLWQRRRMRNKVKGKYENWLEDTARRQAFDSFARGAIDMDELKMSLDSVSRLVSAYTFKWNGDAYKAAMSQIPGVAKIHYLLMEDANEVLRKEGKPTQKWTESDFVNWVIDPVMSSLLGAAWQTVMDNSPNFHTPPIPGVED